MGGEGGFWAFHRHCVPCVPRAAADELEISMVGIFQGQGRGGGEKGGGGCLSLCLVCL